MFYIRCIFSLCFLSGSFFALSQDISKDSLQGVFVRVKALDNQVGYSHFYTAATAEGRIRKAKDRAYPLSSKLSSKKPLEGRTFEVVNEIATRFDYRTVLELRDKVGNTLFYDFYSNSDVELEYAEVLENSIVAQEFSDQSSKDLFSYTLSGLQKDRILTFDKKTNREIYSLALAWANEHLDEPKSNILLVLENKKIRFKYDVRKGVEDRLTSSNILLEFKEKKMRFVVQDMRYLSSGQTATDFVSIDLNDGSKIFKPSGEARYNMKQIASQIELILNSVLLDLHEYILQDGESTHW